MPKPFGRDEFAVQLAGGGHHPGMVLILTIEQADEIERIGEHRLHGLRCP